MFMASSLAIGIYASSFVALTFSASIFFLVAALLFLLSFWQIRKGLAGLIALCSFFFLFGLVRAQMPDVKWIPDTLYSYALGLSDWFQHLISSTGLSTETESLISALLLGHRTGLSADTVELFRQTGASHILALSGFHLNTFLLVVNLFFFLLPISIRTRRIASLCTLLPIVWLYAAIAGFPPSLVRAATMASLLQVLLVAGREYHLLNALCFTAFIMLCWNPLQLMNVGFQLSFASLVGIALIVPIFVNQQSMKDFYEKSFKSVWLQVLRFFVGIILITIVCTLSTFPLVAYYFGQVPLFSLLSNVVATLLAYGIMAFSVLFWIFSFWQEAQIFIASILNVLAKGMDSLTTFISSLPHSALPFRPNVIEVILLYVSIVSLFLYIKKRTARPVIVLLVSIILFSLSRIVGVIA